MKRFLLFSLCFITTTSIISPLLKAQDFTNENDRKLSYLFNVRQGSETSEALGLDFDIRYEVERFNQQEGKDNHLSLNLFANGHQDFDSDITNFNQMKFESRIMGRYYNSGSYNLPPFQKYRYAELLEKDGNESTDLTDDERSEMRDYVNLLNDRRIFFSYDIHYLFESTQDINVHQSVFGGGISLYVPYLHELLDGILGLTRPKSPNYRAQPVRIYLGYDYSLGYSGEGVPEAEEKEPYSRARLEGAWRTVVFDGLVLRTTLKGAYVFDDTANLYVNDNFQIYSQSWIEIPINESFGVTATYAIGEIPPLYSKTQTGQIGFSLKLQ